MATSMRKNAIAYYLIAIAVVFGFMAFTLTPAQANDPVEKEPPIIAAPSYEDDDPALIDEAANQVKRGDKVTMTFFDLPVGELELIRLGEPVKKDKYDRTPAPKYEIVKKTFTDSSPSGDEVPIEYTVPCWSLTSENKDDTIVVQANLFFKDGSTGTSYASLTILDSDSICTSPQDPPAADPNYDAFQKDGKKVEGTEQPTPSESTEQPEAPTVAVSAESVKQEGDQLFTISGLPVDSDTAISVLVVSKNDETMGNVVAQLADNKPTNGDPVARVNWTVPCSIAPGKYGVTVDVLPESAGVPSADSQVFTVTAGDCSGVAPSPEPSEDPTEEPSEKPSEKPTEEPSEKPSEDPTEEPSEKPSEDPTEEPSEKPSEDSTEEPSEKPSQDPSEKPSEEPEPQVTLTLHDDSGKEIGSLPRNEKLTIKTSYDGDADSVTFTLNSTPLNLGSAIVKNGAAQIETVIPCSFPLGTHHIEAQFEGKEPVIVKKAVEITQGKCAQSPLVNNAGAQDSTSPLITAGSTGNALAKTGTASMIFAMLALMFAGTGVYLIVSRREHV